MLDFAPPTALVKYLLPELLERRFGHGCLQQLVFSSTQRFFAVVPIKLLAAAVPVEDTAIEIPHEDRLSRKFNEPLLLKQVCLTSPERFLHLTPLGDIHE